MNDHLLLLSAMKLRSGPRGGHVLTRKFVDGMVECLKTWPGPATVLAELDHRPSDSLDNIEVFSHEIPFEVRTVDWSDPQLADQLGGARVVCCSLDDWRQTHIPALCAHLGVPCVYVAEQTPRIRRQIVYAETANPILRARRGWWIACVERKRRAAVRVASGIQCNGVPAYDCYRPLNANALLYFDNRIDESLLVPPAILEERLRRMLAGGPLHLAFSGRFVRMKGVHHLPLVAQELLRLKVPFVMDLFGDGALAPALQSEIDGRGLQSCVRLHGSVPFAERLVPYLSRNSDLFVCCHPQGDPSCTYIETMACGVPVVGYANEALAGLERIGGAAWTTPMGQPHELARLVALLHVQRSAITEASNQARAFALEHTFSKTFRQRVAHLLHCSEQLCEAQAHAASGCC